ncbi:MAG TPA: proline dehydrogenase family protein [Thermoanaerobaculia bacterium]|nr:proline dehydrogenase family protein [Thermoanaerobaculia bacterium]
MTALLDRLVVTTLPLVPKAIVRKVASRYVAGDTLESALGAMRGLAAEGAMGTMDVLGESVTHRDQTLATRDQYLRTIDAIAASGLPANISVKPTAVGLAIDPALALENCAEICTRAKTHGMFVRLDMEDSPYTEATIRLVLALRERFESVGAVLQAYLKRSLSDLDRLLAVKTNVRICKGIYVEPRTIAWKDRQTIVRNFAALVDKQLAGGAYAAIATHDEACVQLALATIDRLRVPKDRYEFQMLLGVDPVLRRSLLDAGHRLRVYVPYGKDWYAYSTRRLKENPSIARHVLRSMAGLGPAAV